jgi:uncharacterized membrane protein YuzA (DUF378 family)
MNEAVTGAVMIAIGVLAILGAALNWRLVTHSGRILNRLLGDRIARAVYAAVGLAPVIIGVLRLFW